MDESEAARRLLEGAETPEEREALRKLLEHQSRVSHARSIELFVQGLAHIHAGFSEEYRRFRKLRHMDAGLMVIKTVACALLLLGVYLVLRGVFT